jgi:hypothetical protein
MTDPTPRETPTPEQSTTPTPEPTNVPVRTGLKGGADDSSWLNRYHNSPDAA